jgi:mono/diheme cytochrome c family protein
MRHLVANIVTYAIAGLLVLGAGVFAWVRSAQVVLTDEATLAARFAPTPAYEFRWQEQGERSYIRNCASCHGGAGEGWDQYPPLDETAELFLRDGGREYLIDLHLWGSASDRWQAPMPRMAHLPDAELAAVMNHVLTSYGNELVLPPDAELYLPAEVAARRGPRLPARAVELRRP